MMVLIVLIMEKKTWRKQPEVAKIFVFKILKN